MEALQSEIEELLLSGGMAPCGSAPGGDVEELRGRNERLEEELEVRIVIRTCLVGWMCKDAPILGTAVATVGLGQLAVRTTA